jgi:hypothetical protein
MQRGYVDCPWWPDLFVSAGESLLGGTIGRWWPRDAPLLRPRQRFVYEAADFAFRQPGGAPELQKALRRHPHFEDAPALYRRVFGHHQAYLVAF